MTIRIISNQDLVIDCDPFLTEDGSLVGWRAIFPRYPVLFQDRRWSFMIKFVSRSDLDSGLSLDGV